MSALELSSGIMLTSTGDWGWYVVRTMSLLYPKACLATHFNMDVADPPEALIDKHPEARYPLPENPTAREVRGVERNLWFDDEGSLCSRSGC